MALELNLTKNTNEKIEGTLGKYYARVEYKGTLSKADLAEHMHEHNAIYSQGLVEGILTDAAKCIRELALQGFVVKIDNLGLFKASVDANGLTLEKGAKIAAGRGAQRTDEELQANPAAQQFAVGDVKLRGRREAHHAGHRQHHHREDERRRQAVVHLEDQGRGQAPHRHRSHRGKFWKHKWRW